MSSYLITSSAIAIAVMSSIAVAQTITVPPMPANLQVPDGNVVYAKGNAVGTQNYICKPSGTSYAWTLFGPQATLFVKIKLFGVEITQQVMTHFLSANPDEGGTARATWQSSLDTSAVWAMAIQNSTDPNYVAPGSIAWLLLKVVGSEPGPTAGSLLTSTTFIQRLNTSAGVAPATGCDSSTVGGTVLVPYTTDYYFYKAK
jgi:hypothetical protein